MAQAPKPAGGRRPGQFGTTELRLGRASGIGEFYDVLEDATAKRLERTIRGYAHAAVSSAVSPLPAFLQAGIYDAVTHPFRGREDGGASQEDVPQDPSSSITTRGSEGAGGIANDGGTADRVATEIGMEGSRIPVWQSNLEKLFKVPLPVTFRKQALNLLETEREKGPEKVKEEKSEEEKESSGIFGTLLSGLGSIGKFLLGPLLKTLGIIGLDAMRFAGGLGIIGLIGSLVFSKEIVDQFRLDFAKEAKNLGANSGWGARVTKFLGGGTENGKSFADAAQLGITGGAVTGLAGLMVGGPWGALIGFLLGTALVGVGAALGEARLTQGTNFITTWWEKTWDSARKEWEKAEQVQLNKQLDQLQKRKESGKVTGFELLKLNKQIRETERLIFQSRLQELKSWQGELDNQYAEAGERIRVSNMMSTKLTQLSKDISSAKEGEDINMILDKFMDENFGLMNPDDKVIFQDIMKDVGLSEDSTKDQVTKALAEKYGNLAGPLGTLMSKFGGSDYLVDVFGEGPDATKEMTLESLNTVIKYFKAKERKDIEWRKGLGGGALEQHEIDKVRKLLKQDIKDQNLGSLMLDESNMIAQTSNLTNASNFADSAGGIWSGMKPYTDGTMGISSHNIDASSPTVVSNTTNRPTITTNTFAQWFKNDSDNMNNHNQFSFVS